MNHYRSFKCFIPKTGAERDADTVEFFPQQVPFPQVNNETFLREATSDTIAIIQARKPTILSLTYGDTPMNIIIDIATIIQRVAPLQFPKEMSDISNGTSQPRVTPSVAPTTLLTLPEEDEIEPRVTPTAVSTAPHILPSHDVSEPRVNPTAAPIKPLISITPIHAPHINKPLPHTKLPSVTVAPPKTGLLSPKHYDNLHGSKIVK